MFFKADISLPCLEFIFVSNAILFGALFACKFLFIYIFIITHENVIVLVAAVGMYNIMVYVLYVGRLCWRTMHSLAWC